MSLPVLRIHASRSGYFTQDGKIIDFETVVSSIESSPLKGKDLRLNSCWTASTGLASRLAQRLEVWIHSPSHAPMWTFKRNEDGTWQILDATVFCRRAAPEDNYWGVFDPSGELRMKYPVTETCANSDNFPECGSGCVLLDSFDDEGNSYQDVPGFDGFEPALPGVPALPTLD